MELDAIITDLSNDAETLKYFDFILLLIGLVTSIVV